MKKKKKELVGWLADSPQDREEGEEEEEDDHALSLIILPQLEEDAPFVGILTQLVKNCRHYFSG